MDGFPLEDRMQLGSGTVSLLTGLNVSWTGGVMGLGFRF